MERPKFNPELEMQSGKLYKESPGMFGRPVAPLPKFSSPITPKENALMVLRDKVKPLWIPNQMQDFNLIQPMVMKDAKARVEGGLDWFGVEWIAQPELGSSMVDHTKGCRLKSIADWEKEIEWPNLSEVDWESNAAYLKTFYDKDRLTYCTLVNGLFERLISILSFEEALIALILERDAVNSFFEKLCDWYIELFGILKKYYDVEVICFHDDWGSQLAPLFSADCLTSCIIPHIKRLAGAAHELGIIFDLHSCGKVEEFVPYMIEAGVDMWEGQNNNDKAAIRKKYEGQIAVFDSLKFKPDDDYVEIIRDYVESLAADGGAVVRISDPDNDNTIKYMQALYSASRDVYSR